MVRQRGVFDVLKLARAASEWDRIRELYQQIMWIRPAGSARPVPIDLRDALAERLSEAANSYHGKEARFVDHALAVFAAVHDQETFDADLYRWHYSLHRAADLMNAHACHLPTIFEAVVETGRRFREARQLQEALAGLCTAGVLCGSVSYGPFFNVHGASDLRPASDLDLIVIVRDASTLPNIANRLARLSGLEQQEVDEFGARATIFQKHFDDDKTVFSHKAPIWSRQDPVLEDTGIAGGYRLSLHILTLPTVRYVLVENSTTLSPAAAGRKRTVQDYRNTFTDRQDQVRTFAGREYSVKPELTKVDLGWLRPMTLYQVDDAGSYCPGLLQTMFLPLLEVRWDELSWQPQLRAFVHKLYNRCREEGVHHPHAILRPSLTHVRREILAPHIIRRLDREDLRN